MMPKTERDLPDIKLKKKKKITGIQLNRCEKLRVFTHISHGEQQSRLVPLLGNTNKPSLFLSPHVLPSSRKCFPPCCGATRTFLYFFFFFFFARFRLRPPRCAAIGSRRSIMIGQRSLFFCLKGRFAFRFQRPRVDDVKSRRFHSDKTSASVH